MSVSKVELERRLAALEAALGDPASPAGVEARLAAIESAVRRLRASDPKLAEADEALDRCGELVEAHLPAGAELGVISEAGPPTTTLRGRPVSLLRHAEAGAGLVARLEAARVSGIGFLLIPATGRPWLTRYPELGEHLLARYRPLADDPEVGLVVDLRARDTARQQPHTLAEVLLALGRGERFLPVLDWTEADLAPLVADQHVFVPPAPTDGALPFLDRTIAVIVIADAARLEEARRVAAVGVVRVELDRDGVPEVVETEAIAEGDAGGDGALVVVARPPTDRPWTPWVEEALSDQPMVSVVAAEDPWPAVAAADTEAALVLAPGVLPLPGCVETAVATLLADKSCGAVAGKLLAADGSLRAAGTTVFADGSAAGLGDGSPAAAAPWHEYVRPVCAGSGLLAVRPRLIHELAPDGESLEVVSGRIWASGREVRYQPAAWAVLAREDGWLATQNGRLAEAWAPVLKNRPPRPTVLDAAAWRALIADDDLRGCWR